MLSVQVLHLPLAQFIVMQSVSALQSLPSLHFGQVTPPQSMSVSSPLSMPSVQLTQVPPEHVSLALQPAVIGPSGKHLRQVPAASQKPVCPLQASPTMVVVASHIPPSHAQGWQG